MRRSCSETDFIINHEGGDIIGVGLGYDHCSEHEQGIKPLKKTLGLDLETPGLDRFRVPATPKVEWVKGKSRDGEWEGFGLSKRGGQENLYGSLRNGDPLAIYGDTKLAAAWDDSEFVVVGFDEESIKSLRYIYQGFAEGVVVLTQGGSSNPFGGSGPCFIRTDNDPEVWARLDTKLRAEQEAHAQWLVEWAEESEGLYEDLVWMNAAVVRVSGSRGWQATPWIYLGLKTSRGNWTYEPRPSNNSEGKKVAWLNPWRQQLWSCGWFTSEELRQWAVGDGPVWPLCVALPPGEHPFWKAVFDSVPSPDQANPKNGGWNTFNANLGDEELWGSLKGIGPKMAARIVKEREENGPFADANDVGARVPGIGPYLVGVIRRGTNYCPISWYPFPHVLDMDDEPYSVYYRGNGFWHWAEKEWGFRLEGNYRSQGCQNSVFREEIALAKERGLPTLGFLTDFDKLSEKVDAWNEANPDHHLDFMIYGRGTDALKNRIAAAVEALKTEREAANA